MTETHMATEHDQTVAPADQQPKRSKSMHDGVPVWCDCCSCEAEPYWVAVGEEMGIDLGSNYTDADME